MRRILVTAAVTAGLLSGGLGLTTATTSATPAGSVASVPSVPSVASVGWCDGVTKVTLNGRGDHVRQPYHRATGSRNCTLAEGTQGSAVIALQQALKSCNFASALTVDGDFGPNTKKAVAYAQSRYGIAADGIYGQNSRKAFGWPVYSSNSVPTGNCVRTG